jgi:hypothetical protein
VVEHVGVLCKFVPLVGDGELDFADDLSVLDSHHDIMGAPLQPVRDLDHFELIRVAQLQDLVVDLDDLPLARSATATHQVVDLEGDEVDVGGPLEVVHGWKFGEFHGNCE